MRPSEKHLQWMIKQATPANHYNILEDIQQSIALGLVIAERDFRGGDFREFAYPYVTHEVKCLIRDELRKVRVFSYKVLDSMNIKRKHRVFHPPSTLKTAKQKRDFKRNAVIASAYIQGCSQRFIAEAVGLPRSRVAEIITDFKRRYPIDE